MVLCVFRPSRLRQMSGLQSDCWPEDLWSGPIPRQSRSHRHEHTSAAPRYSRVLCWWFALNAFLLLPRQITWQQLWWHLARGREAFLGSTQPSADLLLAASQPEADWLSGVPGFCVFLVGETAAISTVIPALLALLAWLALRPVMRSTEVSPEVMLLMPLLLLLVRDGTSSQPLLLAGGLLLITPRIVLRNLQTRSAAALSGLIFGTLWANLAPGAPWGILILLFAPPLRAMPVNTVARSRQQPILADGPDLSEIRGGRATAAPAFAIGMLLTPAGLTGVRDQVTYCLADLSASWRLSQDILTAGDIVVSPSATSLHLVLLVMLGVVGCLLQNSVPGNDTTDPFPRWKFTLWHLLPLLMVLLNREFLGLAAICFTCNLPPAPTSLNTTQPEHPRRQVLPVSGLLTLVLLLDAGGFAPWSRQTWGWGISQELDLRLLNLPAAPAAQPPAPVFSSDVRTTGLAAWLTPQLQPIDHPQAAFREGRLHRWLRLLIDLRADHRAVYQLSDGTIGGWHRELAQWNTRYLLLPVEQQELIEAVQRMDWNIIDLDSPNVPFAVGSDLLHQKAITTSAGEQDFVQFGPWIPDVEVYSRDSDRFSISLPAGHSAISMAAIRQARLFRSLKLETAALRSLGPVRPALSQAVQTELLLAQQDLAWMEWNNFGQPCRFRCQILELGREKGLAGESQPWAEPAASDSATTQQIRHAASSYLYGTVSEARALLESIEDTAPDLDYAIATLLLEEGETAAASAVFARIFTSDPPAHLRRAALWWKTRIDSYLPGATDTGVQQ